MSSAGHTVGNPDESRIESQPGSPVKLRWRYYNPVRKDYATFLETSEASAGRRTLIEIEVAPGGGAAPHYHLTRDEHFEVLRGALEVRIGGDTLTLKPGEKATAPRNVLHSLRNRAGEPAKFLVEIRPGHPGFEKALRAGYGLAGDGRVFPDGTPKNPYHLAVLLEWSETRLPNLFTAVEPLMRWLARRARRKGVDRELEARYCR